ncbi:hypothetical protein CIW71_08635 [Xanthomonas citri pv. malvacearum]|nr:hypothetical protein CIW71_08635 [Xanthomonas citri pv. malvacearum]
MRRGDEHLPARDTLHSGDQHQADCLQYINPDEACTRSVERDVLMRLHDHIKLIDASAFAHSKLSFSVIVQLHAHARSQRREVAPV